MKKAKAAEVLGELKRYLQKRRSISLNKAFTAWYVDSRFGELPGIQKSITDRGKDGGIDAVVRAPSMTYVFQMKYEEVIKLRNLSRSDIRDFDGVANLFFAGDEVAFEKWLATAREDLHRLYREVFKKMHRDKFKTRFILVTTKRDALDLDVSGIEI